MFFLLIPVLINILPISCSYEDDPAESEIISTEASDFVRDMGIGINIGNSLDAINNRASPTPLGETGWGNPLINLDYIQALKNFGFKSIRLPVTWAEYLGKAPDYTIEPERMNRVAEVVDWILGEDMYCIINLHHDGGDSPGSWIKNFQNNEEEIGNMFVKVWQQIAGHFMNYSNKLIFESMNEVGFNSGYKEERYRKMNKLNQLFVDTVRASGANNAVRYLLIAGFWTDIDQTTDPLFLIPNDPVANRQIISVHYYTPSQFTIASSTGSGYGYRDNWGNDEREAADHAALERNFQKLIDRFIVKGIPAVIGEYGVVKTNKVEEGRIKWLTAVTKICLDNGICPMFWDNGNGEVIIRRSLPYRKSSTLDAVWENLVL